MYIVVIAWLYVALMMAVAEATSSSGSLLGAGITFLLYGALPLGLVVYVMGAPARGRAIKQREEAQWAASRPTAGSPSNEPPANAKPSSEPTASLNTDFTLEPDAGGETPADTVTPVRKET